MSYLECKAFEAIPKGVGPEPNDSPISFVAWSPSPVCFMPWHQISTLKRMHCRQDRMLLGHSVTRLHSGRFNFAQSEPHCSLSSLVELLRCHVSSGFTFVDRESMNCISRLRFCISMTAHTRYVGYLQPVDSRSPHAGDWCSRS